jgi:ATP-dependent Clp protease ATP-binding subunit ClpB
MAADEFSEDKYTEAAWGIIAALTSAADYYQASTIEAPLLLEILLNPTKHNAGDDAESARTVAVKILQSAGVNVKSLRSELEKYLAKQPKVSDNAQKMMGRTLSRVLNEAKNAKAVLGVSDSIQSY